MKKIELVLGEEDIERIIRSLDNQRAYTRAQNFEGSGYKRLADLFRGFLKRGTGKSKLAVRPDAMHR